MFPKINRISLPSDFYKIKKFGKKISNQYFSLVYLNDDNLLNSTFSVIVSKKISKKASQRNKLKRITKAIVIKNREVISKNIKCLIFPKIRILSTKNSELESQILQLFGQIK